MNKSVVSELDCSPLWRSPKPVSCQPDEAGGCKVPLDCFYKEVKGIIMNLPAKGVCWPLVFCFSPDFQAFSGEKLVFEVTFQPPTPTQFPRPSEIWALAWLTLLSFGISCCWRCSHLLQPRSTRGAWKNQPSDWWPSRVQTQVQAACHLRDNSARGDERPGALFLKLHGRRLCATVI